MREEIYPTQAVTPAPSHFRRVSWGAIIAGLFVTVVIQLILTLLGAAIGAAYVNPMQEKNPAQGLATGAGIWLIISSLISIWVGSCVAGRLCGGPRRADGMLHGIVTWSAATVAAVFLLATTAGALLGGTGVLLKQAMGSNSSGGHQQMASLNEAVQQAFPESSALLPPTGRTDQGAQPPGQLTQLAQQDPKVGAALAKMEAKGGASQDPQSRDELINLLVSNHSMDQTAAANLVNQWDQNFQKGKAQAQQKARQAGQSAAEGISKGALWGLIALILELAVAAWGGWVGTASLRRPVAPAPVPA